MNVRRDSNGDQDERSRRRGVCAVIGLAVGVCALITVFPDAAVPVGTTAGVVAVSAPFLRKH
ncbi:hypothetical protein [Streptomyces tauricus]|uniref:hypothetical protein n=1 Tax=Streptomyces tauricus TaxID=68274 RepID=UPI0033F167F3